MFLRYPLTGIFNLCLVSILYKNVYVNITINSAKLSLYKLKTTYLALKIKCLSCTYFYYIYRLDSLLLLDYLCEHIIPIFNTNMM